MLGIFSVPRVAGGDWCRIICCDCGHRPFLDLACCWCNSNITSLPDGTDAAPTRLCVVLSAFPWRYCSAGNTWQKCQTMQGNGAALSFAMWWLLIAAFMKRLGR